MIGLGLNGSLLMGSQALSAQQLAISTIGNNISNINTPGYARQRANLVTTDILSQTNGDFGTGVTVANIEGVRSSLLDTMVQQSLGSQGYADSAADLSSTTQQALGENFNSTTGTASGSSTTSTGAAQTALSNFFTALQDLASTPTDPSVRQEVVQDGRAVANSLNDAYARVQQTQTQVAKDAGSIATQINQLATGIASLNKQIIQVQASSGSPANNLIDTRAAALDQLSQLVNVNTTTLANGAVDVALADNSSVQLVNGIYSGGAGSTQTLSVSFNATSATPLTVSASSTGALGTGVPSSGSLGAHLEVANNLIGAPAASGGTGVLAQLDDVANQLRTQMNAQNQAGYDLNNNAGTAFFTGTGAGDLAVSSSIAANPSLIAAGNGTGKLDGSNAAAMANLRTSATILPALQTTVTDLGSATSQAASNKTTQDQVTTQLQNQRNSVSGVSIDEEMTNLISFQQAYAASARFITTISSLYDTLIHSV